MKTITLTNDFHGTEVRVRAGSLSVGSVRRARNTLCGLADCTCAQTALGTRGPQRTPDGRRIAINDAQSDGSAEVWIEETTPLPRHEF